ncbi:latent-transforming growth factor beta-binding protein 2-like [Chanos chanos]|uniref:Latent-transforming growth factor beta-binding protein 1 n=1 Tax=Chanos chanos TaxID=29144 RepID=A0A6J2ULP5_CHACN|nr:latent-transforming growth factor beta-binding protein 2 [Chanos chanos]
MTCVWILVFSAALAISQLQTCDSHKDDNTGGRHEAAAPRAASEQLRAQLKGPSLRTMEMGSTTDKLTSHSLQQNRLSETVSEIKSPQNAKSRLVNVAAIARVSPQDECATVPLNKPRRVPRQLGRTQSAPQRAHTVTRQSTPSHERKSSASRRLVGPHVCGGQQCCSGWAVAPGTNRCIKPDCQPPCQNRGSCSRPHTCVCRSGFQGSRCEEVAPEQVYVRTGTSRVLTPVRPGSKPGQRHHGRRRPTERQAIDTSAKTQTPKPASTKLPLSTVTQGRHGQSNSSPQQTGTSRTVKRYPSSTGPITSNALPNGHTTGVLNGAHHGQIYLHNSQRDAANGQVHSAHNTGMSADGANLTANVDRIKIVFTPMVCRRICNGGRCYNSCERGDKTTVYSENQGPPPKSQGFRLFFCQIPCQNGGKCVGRDECWCPSNSTGKFCHLPAPATIRPTPSRRANSNGIQNSSSHSMYTLPLSNQQASMHPSLVNVHVQHPPEAEVQIHQVARVKPGQTLQNQPAEGVHSVQQRSQPNNGHVNAQGNGKVLSNHRLQNHRLNGRVGRCFQETIDGQCGKPLPGLTKQDDCCGSVGASWGLNKCTECPSKPAYAVIANGQVECPKGFKRMNITHCQDINECLMPGICKRAECLNTKGSYRCTCKPGFMLDQARSHCISDKAISEERATCYRSVSAGTCALPLAQRITKQICCCSRVGKAWGSNCERCPLPDTDHFKEICPAGHGYTYSRSDIQITLRQLEEEELSRAAESQPPQIPSYPQTPQIIPQTPQIITPHHQPQTPTHSQIPQPQHPHQQPPVPVGPPKQDTAEESVYQPTVVDSVVGVSDVVEITPRYPTRLRPDTEDQDTASIDVATKVTDIDRCALTPGICGPGQCIPVQTGYTCYCDNGYKLNALQTRCIDINECEEDPCGGKGKCVNTFGSYTCQCFTGYSLVITQNRKFCQDVNECDMPSKCPDGRCVNTEGSYTCECNSGFTKNPRGQCEDVDECLSPGACPVGKCVNTVGSFQCQSCDPGFRAVSGRCLDINECQISDVCANGRCVNTEGSFNCTCNQGFHPTPDHKSCQDINECLLPNTCTHGSCVNLKGSYRCMCNFGYQTTSGGRACEDINECTTRNVCPGGICTNTEGSYTCTNCQAGYVRSADGQSCEDIDECSQTSLCVGGVCVNTDGSYTCTLCENGYTLSQDKQRCEDIDECLSPSACYNGVCLNSEGSYSCVDCPSGYRISADGEVCEDIDECASPSTCPQGTCTNTDGSFTCTMCSPGYRVTEDGKQCEDVDECQSPDVCPMGVCTNTEGSFSCMTCDFGYKVSSDGQTCEDINECEDVGNCVNGECINNPGSYTCVCPMGFDLKGTSCKDIDECESMGICGEGDCLNTDGSYLCVCPPGYSLLNSGLGCQDVDECAEGSVCSNGQCLNTDGSFQCVCEAGYKFSTEKEDCEDRDECKEYGSDICGTWRCENTLGSYRCFMGCQPGFDGKETGECDIDECVNETICGDHGFCENTDGSYRCQCDRGYTNAPDSPGCVDADECESSSALCGDALCENVEGSFLCICPSENEEFDPLTTKCTSSRTRIPEFSASHFPSLPHAASTDNERKVCYYNLNDGNICFNVLSHNVTKQECCCTAGASWGNCEDRCPLKGQDLDECKLFAGEICKNGRCVNFYSSYSCLCHTGYYYDNMRLECVDHDECVEENACESGMCVNTQGSYNCFCSPPLVLDNTRRRCISLNGTEDAYRGSDGDDDLYTDICWQSVTHDFVCSDPLLGVRTTYTECCCLRGIAWGDCAFCPDRSSMDFATLCNLAGRGSDSLRERPGFEYGPDLSPDGTYGPPYWGNYGPLTGTETYYSPEDTQNGPVYTDPSSDYNTREGARVPVQWPREHQPPRRVDPNRDRSEGFEGLRAEECGILNGCENGRCVRVREGYTCDCFDGYELNLSQMACIDINECEDISDSVALCKNGVCTNTEGSYKCNCLPGFMASAKPHECIPEEPVSATREAGK